MITGLTARRRFVIHALYSVDFLKPDRILKEVQRRALDLVISEEAYHATDAGPAADDVGHDVADRCDRDVDGEPADRLRLAGAGRTGCAGEEHRQQRSDPSHVFLFIATSSQ